MSGSDGTITVDMQKVQTVETSLANALKKLQSRLNELDSDLGGLLSGWSSDAQAAYKTDKAKWDQAAQDMNTVLGQITKAVSDAHETYVNVNSSTTKLFS